MIDHHKHDYDDYHDHNHDHERHHIYDHNNNHDYNHPGEQRHISALRGKHSPLEQVLGRFHIKRCGKNHQ